MPARRQFLLVLNGLPPPPSLPPETSFFKGKFLSHIRSTYTFLFSFFCRRKACLVLSAISQLSLHQERASKGSIERNHWQEERLCKRYTTTRIIGGFFFNFPLRTTLNVVARYGAKFNVGKDWHVTHSLTHSLVDPLLYLHEGSWPNAQVGCVGGGGGNQITSSTASAKLGRPVQRKREREKGRALSLSVSSYEQVSFLFFLLSWKATLGERKELPQCGICLSICTEAAAATA